jgi:hypothetical protein
MKSKLHLITLGLFLISFALNLIVFGALAAIPKVGEEVRQSAQRESVTMSVYIALGAFLQDLPGVGAVGAALADEGFGAAFSKIEDEPSAAMDVLMTPDYGGLHGLLRFNYSACPVLLVLWILAWYFRPRMLHLSKRSR